MKEYTDNEIIECLKSRQSYVVRYLSERYMPMIRLMVYQLGGSLEDAKDIFQDGLIIMLEKIDNEDFVLTCKFKTFLYCVCENLWKAVLEKRKAAANYFSRREIDNNEKDFTEIQDNALYENIFYEVFETLDPASQKLLKLYWDEMSAKEIADTLGLTYGYVRKKKCEVQAELVNKVKNHPDYKQIIISNEVIRDVVR
ncbi:MAG TPA: sigma-70 family RNA polymerase sigma factor [Bacteroidales bacterium]|nr:sigma-70 family RNA polymerase sigma factor [Bacteroidales bacterium]